MFIYSKQLPINMSDVTDWTEVKKYKHETFDITAFAFIAAAICKNPLIE